MALDISRMTAEEIQNYKTKQKEIMGSFKIGGIDPVGNKITRILSISEDYAIYEIETDEVSESLRVQVYTIEPDDPNNLEDNFTQIKVALNEVRSVLYKARRDNSFKNIISSAISLGLNGNIEDSKNILNDIKSRIEKEHKAQFLNKLTFLFSNMFFMIIFCVISISQYTGIINFYKKESIIFILINVATFGSIGGFISVSLKLKKKNFETGVPNFMYIAYGFERAIISVIGSIILYFMIVSDLVLGYIMKLDEPIYTLLTFSAVAGFSENLIPDLFEKLQQGIKTNE